MVKPDLPHAQVRIVEIKSIEFQSEELFSLKKSSFLYWIDKKTKSLVSFHAGQVDFEKRSTKVENEEEFFDESEDPFVFKSYPLSPEVLQEGLEQRVEFFTGLEVVVFSEAPRPKPKPRKKE